METYDLVIKQGRVIDPVSRWEDVCQIGIRAGRITTLSRDDLSGDRVIDATGLVVCPGFIDIHSHVDGSIPAGEHSVLMGVTTVIGGNCGTCYIPEGLNIGAFLDRIDQEGFPVHHGVLAGGSDLREALDVNRYAAAPEEALSRMTGMAQEALDQGALGLSFGLAYAPGTKERELVKLFKIAARNEVPVAVHPRYAGTMIPGYGRDAVAGQEELIDVAAKTGAGLQISHLGSQIAWRAKPYDALLKSALAVIERAREAGVDVTADCHPYDAWCTRAGAATIDPFVNPAILRLFNKYQMVDITDIDVAGGPYRGRSMTVELLNEIRQKDPEAQPGRAHDAGGTRLQDPAQSFCHGRFGQRLWGRRHTGSSPWGRNLSPGNQTAGDRSGFNGVDRNFAQDDRATGSAVRVA